MYIRVYIIIWKGIASEQTRSLRCKAALIIFYQAPTTHHPQLTVSSYHHIVVYIIQHYISSIMFKSILLIAVSFIAVSTAQIANAPQRIRGDNAIVGEKNAFGRTKTTNLRNSERDLQASMSMVVEVEEPVPVEIPDVCDYPILCSIGFGMFLDCSGC